MDVTKRTVSAKVSMSTWRRVRTAVASPITPWKTVSDFHREAIERLLREIESTMGSPTDEWKSHLRADSGEHEVAPSINGEDTRMDERISGIAETRSDLTSADTNESDRARPASDETSSPPDRQKWMDGVVRAARQARARRRWRPNVKKARDESRGR